jgi:hypothetical protein
MELSVDRLYLTGMIKHSFIGIFSVFSGPGFVLSFVQEAKVKREFANVPRNKKQRGSSAGYIVRSSLLSFTREMIKFSSKIALRVAIEKHFSYPFQGVLGSLCGALLAYPIDTARTVQILSHNGVQSRDVELWNANGLLKTAGYAVASHFVCQFAARALEHILPEAIYFHPLGTRACKRCAIANRKSNRNANFSNWSARYRTCSAASA